LALTASTTLRAAVAPHQVIASPSDADVKTIDILTPRRTFHWELLEDAVQFVDESFNSGVGKRLGG